MGSSSDGRNALQERWNFLVNDLIYYYTIHLFITYAGCALYLWRLGQKYTLIRLLGTQEALGDCVM